MDGPFLTREQISDMLREHGVNLTRQRMEIAGVLFARRQHLSADQIFAMVNRRCAETSKATVYNTLKLFVERGLVREVIVDPTRVYYDPETSPHHHLYDVETGELHDIPAAGVVISGLPPLPEDRVAESVHIIVRARRASRA